MPETLTTPDILTPQMVPGGVFNALDEDLRRALQDIIADVYENLNLLFVEINTVGQGSIPALTIGHSDFGSTATAPDAHLQLIGGATCLLVTEVDKQIVVGFWYLSDSATNEYTVALVKSQYPYKIWSNLSGTSKTPTTIVYAGAGTHNSGNPCLCENAAGDILVGYFDRNTNAPKVAQYVRDGVHWEYAATTTLATTYSFDNATLGEIIASADESGNEILLWGRVDNRGGVESAHIYKFEAGTWGTGPVATWTTFYDSSIAGCTTLTGPPAGEDCRLIKMDGDYVLALWPWRGNSADSRYTLLFALSDDGGETWPQTACAGSDYAIGYPDTASGSIFPINGGTPPVSQANMRGPSAGANTVCGRTWDAAYIPGTTKVAIALWGDAVATHVHNQRAGLRYLEFDRTYNDDTGGADDLSEWVTITRHALIVGVMLSCSDGTPRLAWGQGVSTTVNDGAISLMFAEVMPGQNPLNPLAWTTPKEVLRFTDEASAQQLQYFQFTAPVTGVFEDAGGLVVWPILCARFNLNAVTLGAPSTQAMLFLLPIEELDEAEELIGTESLISLENLIAYWNLNEASGSLRFDSVGDNHLIDNNSVAQAGGKIDRSASFDGAADYLSKPDNDDLSLTNLNGGFTFFGWIYPTAAGNEAGIMAKAGAGGIAEYKFEHDASGTLIFSLSDTPNTSSTSISSATDMNFNAWNFFCVRYDSAVQQLSLRVNAGAWATPVSHTGGVYNGGGEFRFGRDTSVANQYWPGRNCDWGYYKRKLTDAEVEILWNDGDALRYPFTG